MRMQQGSTGCQWGIGVRAAVVGVLAAALGCQLPHDARGTAERARGGVIRVGASEHPPWVQVQDGTLGGVEVALMRALAERWDARIEWTRGSEAELIERLHRGQLDVVLAGLHDATPWSDRVALTEPYITVRDPTTGKKQHHVWASAPGESRWLLELDRFLQSHRHQAQRLVQEARP